MQQCDSDLKEWHRPFGFQRSIHPPFAKIVNAVARNSECPLVVFKSWGDVWLQKILVPLGSISELGFLEPVLRAMALVPDHRITLLRLMPRETLEKELNKSERELAGLLFLNAESEQISIRVVAAESRIHAILETARQFDLVIMSANNQRGFRRAFFGSLAEDIAQRVDCTMRLVRGGLRFQDRFKPLGD